LRCIEDPLAGVAAGQGDSNLGKRPSASIQAVFRTVKQSDPIRRLECPPMMPRAPIEPEGTFEGLSASAILFGAFVDVVATLIASNLLVLFLAPEVVTGDENHAREVLLQLFATKTYTVASVAVGALCTVLGAFAGARRAGQLQVRHGGWIAVTSTAL